MAWRYLFANPGNYREIDKPHKGEYNGNKVYHIVDKDRASFTFILEDDYDKYIYKMKIKK